MPVKAAPPATLHHFSGYYEHGAPLSDIGEEELTPKSKISRSGRSPSPTEPESPTPSGPLKRHRRSSSDASSNGSDIGDWENFDTSKMMSGRLAADVAKQDEEDIDGIDGIDSKRNSMITITGMDQDEMAILNAKAEKILANARKRLTHMEDNLSKARHSVLWSPRSSPNMSELHQPAGGLYRSISLAGVGRRSKPLYQPVLKSNLSHTRGMSDTTHTSGGLKRLSMIPEARSSSAQEFSRRGESPQLAQHSRFSPGPRYTAASPASSRSVHSPMRILEEEEDSPTSTIKTSPDTNTPRGLGINTFANQTKENVSEVYRSESPTLMRSASAASTRSIRSRMSDLKIHIADLKAKTQEDKQRRGSAQSRNTPSPFSHNSNPEQWYTSAPEYKEGGSPLNTNAGVGWSPVRENQGSIAAQITPVTPQAASFLDTEPAEAGDSALKSDARTDVNTPSLHKRTVDVIPIAFPDDRVDSVIDDSYYEDAAQHFEEEDEQIAASEEEQVYLNEVLEESLQDAEPQVPDIPDQFLDGEPEAERHEDRLDAFDYENMFLHSAMGNYTGPVRSRSNSDSSETSVETRRADQATPTAPHRVEDDEEVGSDESDEEETLIIQNQTGEDSETMPTPRALAPPSQPWLKHTGRSPSVDSVSTVNTFATATEGGRHDNDDEDDTPDEILQWGNETGFPQPPMTSPKREMAGAFPTPPLSARLEPEPPLRVVTGNAFSNGIPTPTQSPMPVLANPPAPRPLQPAMDDRPHSMLTTRSNTSDGHPGNTEILMESLIKLADPDFKISGDGSTFADVDKDLVLSLLRSLGSVCNGVLKSNGAGEVREVKVLRRRLDDARRVLEGEDDDIE